MRSILRANRVWAVVRVMAVIALLAAGLTASSQTAHAVIGATLTVDSISDADDGGDGFCTLREAMYAALNNADYHECVGTGLGYGADFIQFDLANPLITLGSTLPAHSGDTLAIEGSNGGNPVIIDGDGAYRVFDVTGGVLTLGNLTVQNGSASSGGGALVSNSSLIVLYSAFLNNAATADGGAINCNAGCQLTIGNSTLAGNSAGGGGGAVEVNTGTASIYNTTITGNTAVAGGGAISTWNGGDTDPNTTIYNSILANSTAPEDCWNYDAGTLTGGNNIIETTADAPNSCAAVTLSTSDPVLLGSLTGSPGFYGLDEGSPALDLANDIICNGPPVNYNDQRHMVRPLGSHCDIGAAERPPAPAGFNDAYISDVVLYRGGAWLFYDYVNSSPLPGVWTGNPGGACIPAPMDYDGDGTEDFTQLCGGAWHFYNDNGSVNASIWFGLGGTALPVPADYNGDGTDQVVAFQAGAWHVYDYPTGAYLGGTWTGLPSGAGIPVPMDTDGDGSAEPTILASNGAWHFYDTGGAYIKGIWIGNVAGQLPVPGDYDGDGSDDVMVFRGGAWLPYDFATGAYLAGSAVWTGAPPPPAGGGATKPAPIDYDGDGALDLSVFAGGPWHFYNDNGSYLNGIWVGKNVADKPISRRQLP